MRTSSQAPDEETRCPNNAHLTSGKTGNFGWEMLPSRSYGPDLAPSDHHLFGPSRDLMKDQHYKTDEAVQKTVRTWLQHIQAREALAHVSGSFSGVRVQFPRDISSDPRQCLLLYLHLCCHIKEMCSWLSVQPTWIIQLSYFWTLSIVFFLFKTQRFGDWILFPSSGGTYSVEPNR
jgi:hypothetical protein